MNTKKICIRISDKAYQTYHIGGLRHVIKLYVEQSDSKTYHIISCTQEGPGGIYEFEIQEEAYQRYKSSRVFVGLHSSVCVEIAQAKGEYLIKNYSKGFCSLASQCHQINLLECMVHCSEAIPFNLTSDSIGTNTDNTLEQAREIERAEEFPSNIIRIETEDDSGEFIEIVFDENDNLKHANNSDDELNTILHQAKELLYELSPLSSAQSAYDNFTAGEYKEALLNAITILPIAKALKAKQILAKINNIISKDRSKRDVRSLKPKSLSKKEVLEIVDRLEKGSTANTRLVNTKQELQSLLYRLIKNATKIEERAIPIVNKKTGQTTRETLIRYQLDDKTQIVYRTGSGSGGETVNVYGKNPYLNKTIHIKGAR